MATNAEGHFIAELLDLNGYNFPVEMDWSEVFPFWLVAVLDGVIVGCVQVVMGKPLGSAEFLAVKPGLPNRYRVLCVRDLTVAAMACLRMQGCYMAFTFTPFERKDYKEILKNKFGAVAASSGTIMVKKLRSN